MRKKIYFMTPYRSRDFVGNGLVGYYLTKKYGYDVVYRNGYEVQKKIQHDKPVAIIFDHLAWDFKLQQLKYAQSLGLRTVVLPTEGLLNDAAGVVKQAGHTREVTSSLDTFFTWGRFVYNALLSEKMIPAEKVHIVGATRFDHYAPQFRASYPSRQDFLKSLGIKNPDNPYILWATNTDYVARDRERILKNYVEKANYTIEEAQKILDDVVTQFHEHTDLLIYLAERHPDWNFVIKVHPAEWPQSYEHIVAKYPNVYLEHSKPIKNFLVHCDVLLQRNCTTANEAWILGKPVIQTEVADYKREGREEFKTGNHYVRSFEAAEEAIKQYLAGMPVPEDQKKVRERFIEEYYWKVDGKASARAAEYIHKLISDEALPPKDAQAIVDRITASEKKQIAEDNAKLFNKIKDLLGIPRETSLRFWKPWFRKEKNKRKDDGEVEVTPEMISAAYAEYDRLNLLEQI